MAFGGGASGYAEKKQFPLDSCKQSWELKAGAVSQGREWLVADLTAKNLNTLRPLAAAVWEGGVCVELAGNMFCFSFFLSPSLSSFFDFLLGRPECLCQGARLIWVFHFFGIFQKHWTKAGFLQLNHP